MNDFDYIRANSIDAATGAQIRNGARFLAGGTTQIDLMKCGVEQPAELIDITFLNGLSDIVVNSQSIRIGALAKMSQVANNPQIKNSAPVLSESLWRAASAQLRNMATIGGNLMQRTRCSYFRDPTAYTSCNKRTPGSGCSAMNGNNRNHAILGTSEQCIAIYPGDFAVALTAFDANVILQNQDGATRTVKISDFFLLPVERPDLEHDLRAGELIVAVEIPLTPAIQHSHYLKVRDRASYEFAAASAAVGVELEVDGKTVRDIRIALGGVATVPWRATVVEQALKGQIFDEQTLRQAATLITKDATARTDNGFKITLAPRVISRALLTAGGVA
ncbi:xanthine dehydrogenase family protein subunit M [Kluyvera sp. STS39-E]|uniref:FAD binding domain-containing protein n=1 Tax=Enterobacteriaceae TaxID=543 RepID=UPI000E3E961B|nr:MULTISPECIES: xanthine dehydrogenase family protein subunit M [Citrobacter]MBD0826615.1 xanthine dehydrogenase family protein subunit M [Citrobacter sp. C1]RFU93337.1 xanthine dehydrogenase family protein subunit M [Citrobacter gillenii]